MAELCRRHGMSSAAFYTWRRSTAGLDVSDAKRLRAIEEENAKLKRLDADAILDNSGLKELLEKTVTPSATQDAIGLLPVPWTRR